MEDEGLSLDTYRFRVRALDRSMHFAGLQDAKDYCDACLYAEGIDLYLGNGQWSIHWYQLRTDEQFAKRGGVSSRPYRSPYR